MADTKISAAADAGTLVATDKVPLARSASTTAYSATMAEIATWANTNLPVATTTVPGVVKVDGSTITIASGTISAAAAPPPSAGAPAMDGTANAGTLAAWSRGDHVHPNDTSRAPLASPTFTGTPAAPTPTTGDNSTKIATTAFVQAQMVASGAGVSTWNTRAGAVVLQQSDLAALNVYDDAGRNLIHNPTFTVAQRGAGPFGANVYTADRWVISVTGGGATTVQLLAITDASRAAIGDENAQWQLTSTITGTAAAPDCHLLWQRIENVRRLAGKTATVSFWAVAASAGLKVGVNLTQSFGTGGSPSADVPGAGQSITIAPTWARYSLTFTLPSASGKTLGTAGNDYTQLGLWLSSGSNNATASGSIGVQSGQFVFWGVQLEVGAQATPLDYGGSPQQQLQECRRFFQTGKLITAGWCGGAGQGIYFSSLLPVTMRAQPTIAVTDTSGSGNSTYSSSGTYVTGGGVTSIYFFGTAVTAGQSYTLAIGYTASADL